MAGTLGMMQEKLIPSANTAKISAHAAFSGGAMGPSVASGVTSPSVLDRIVSSIGGRMAETRRPPAVFRPSWGIIVSLWERESRLVDMAGLFAVIMLDRTER